MTHPLSRLVAFILLFASLAPVTVSAQSATSSAQTAAAASTATASSTATSDDLRNAIQASVLSDPRVAGIPPAQLQGLIDALVAQARAQHMTAADIIARPQPQQAAAGSTFGQQEGQQPTVCQAGVQGYLCNFNKVFGFEGRNYEIPIFLLVVTAFLIAVIWELILHHRKVLAKAANMPNATNMAGGSAKPLS